jgi:hypothetical protein
MWKTDVLYLTWNIRRKCICRKVIGLTGVGSGHL